MGAESIVVLRDVHKSFGRVEVLKGVSFSVARAAVVCIIGPSGSGKSTLLRCINGLVPIQRGSIRVADFNVHELRRFIRDVVSWPTKQPFLKSMPFRRSKFASIG